MIKINLEHFISKFVFLMAFLLPIEPFTRIIFGLPQGIFRLTYIFTFFGIIIILLSRKKVLQNLDLSFFRIFLILYIWIVISNIINIPNIPQIHQYQNTAVGINSPEFRGILWGIIRVFIFLLFSINIYCLLYKEQVIYSLLKGLIFLAICSCCYSIYQFFGYIFNLPYTAIFSGHKLWGEKYADITSFGLRRVEGFFYEPGPQASFVSIILIILFFLWLDKNNNHKFVNPKFIPYLLILCLIISILTLSPIGFITPVVAIGVYTAFNINKVVGNPKFLSYISKVLLGLLVFIIIGFNVILPKVSAYYNVSEKITDYFITKLVSETFTISDPDVLANPDARSTRNYVGIQTLKDYPIFGVGIGNQIFHYYKYLPDAPFLIDITSNGTLNTYINMLAETGIVGFILFIILLCYPVWLYISRRKIIDQTRNKYLIQGMIVAYISFCLVSFHSVIYIWTPQFWLLYIPLLKYINITYNLYKLDKAELKGQ